MNSYKHIALIRKLKKLPNDDEVAAEWVKTAKGHSAHDHGVGIIVSDDMSVKLIDNGCDNGCKLFTMVNLANRLDDVTVCYKFDLYEE